MTGTITSEFAKRINEEFRTFYVMRARERYEWSEIKFYHRWYLKLLRRQPPFRPYKLPESTSDIITFKRPTPYVSSHDAEEHF